MSIEKYIEAKAAFARHEEKIGSVAATLAKVADALKKQPGRMIFSNVSIGLPMEASLSKDSITIDANALTTPDQMQQMLGQWHHLRDQMMSAWNALSADAQSNVAPPDQRTFARR